MAKESLLKNGDRDMLFSAISYAEAVRTIGLCVQSVVCSVKGGANRSVGLVSENSGLRVS